MPSPNILSPLSASEGAQPPLNAVVRYESSQSCLEDKIRS